MANRFLERLSTGPPLVADGGMGVLVSSAAPRVRIPEEANLRAPETVVKLHVGFIQAGADVIETNTFGANRRKLAARYLEDELLDINSAAVKLAREAREIAGRDVFIAGSIGPLGEGGVAKQERLEIFAEQAAVLEGRGVDFFSVETFFELEELEAAIEAVRGVSSLPILAMLTFDAGAETLSGVTARQAVDRLSELGVAAAGANHGAGIQAALAALSEMGGNGLPLAAMPNIGLASMAGNRIIYPHASPEYFAEFAAHARSLGARVIGGCCGTTPTEIAAIASAVKEERVPSAPLVFAEREVIVAVPEHREETELARAFREQEWVLSVQIDPPLGGSYAGMLDVVRTLKESGNVGLVDINDNATARAAASALMLSVEIERTVGVETIPHLTTRDATIMGLESQLLGAHACGIRNVLSVTGDPPEVGDYPGSRGVYEIDSIGLTQLMARLNRGEDYNGRAIDAATSFYIGVAVNPAADDLDTELERFRQKVDSGAHFAMTQILFDLEYMDRFVERLGGEWPIPVLVGIFPVWSHQLALRLHNEVPGIVVPDRVLNALRDAGPNANEVGMKLGRSLLAEARAHGNGAYVVAPFRRPLGILDALA
ncbi:MAG TPA: bifunctional homocysteine S-methyltransferase/methylenetetrahydrofolate reductase [Gaiellaceae bacterium]|nr:bifunctional homocysteine S-methyltransferase/methylenetetrahydrofolate reductase [Gaiellaceae bacterium]